MSITQERIRRLDELEMRDRDEAFVVPFAATAGGELRDEMARLGSLLAWLRVEGESDGQSLPSPAIDVNERFVEALCSRRSLEFDEARDRFLYATGSVAQLLRQEPIRDRATPTVEELETLRGRLSRLIRFLAAGLAEPAPTSTPTTPTPTPIPVSPSIQVGAASAAKGSCA